MYIKHLLNITNKLKINKTRAKLKFKIQKKNCRFENNSQIEKQFPVHLEV